MVMALRTTIFLGAYFVDSILVRTRKTCRDRGWSCATRCEIVYQPVDGGDALEFFPDSSFKVFIRDPNSSGTNR